MTPDDQTLHQVRRRSRALFGGGQYRAEIGAAIADGDGIVCISDLAEQLGNPPGVASVNAELKILERSGLLSRIDRAKGERRVYLSRVPSAYWSLCQEIVRDAKPQTARRKSQ